MALQARAHTYRSVSVGFLAAHIPADAFCIHRQGSAVFNSNGGCRILRAMQRIGRCGQLGGRGIRVRGQTGGWGCCYYVMQPLLPAETLYDRRVTVQLYYDSTANQMGAPVNKHSSPKSEACLQTHTHTQTQAVAVHYLLC